MNTDHFLAQMSVPPQKLRVRKSKDEYALRPWLAVCPCGWHTESRHWHIVMWVGGLHIGSHVNVSEVCS